MGGEGAWVGSNRRRGWAEICMETLRAALREAGQTPEKVVAGGALGPVVGLSSGAGAGVLAAMAPCGCVDGALGIAAGVVEPRLADLGVLVGVVDAEGASEAKRGAGIKQNLLEGSGSHGGVLQGQGSLKGCNLGGLAQVEPPRLVAARLPAY